MLWQWRQARCLRDMLLVGLMGWKCVVFENEQGNACAFHWARATVAVAASAFV